MKSTAQHEKLNTKAAGIIGLAVMCSRVLGLIREQIFTALFGGGRLMDAFTAAFRIPNLLRDLFAEGALSTAFVTTFNKTAATTAATHLATGQQSGDVAAVTLSLLTLLGVLFAPDRRCWRRLTVKRPTDHCPDRIMFHPVVAGRRDGHAQCAQCAHTWRWHQLFNLGSIVGRVDHAGWTRTGDRVPRLACHRHLDYGLALKFQIPGLARWLCIQA
jgi:hypothetical protein